MRPIAIGLFVGLIVGVVGTPALGLVLGVVAISVAYRLEELEGRLAGLERRRGPLPAMAGLEQPVPRMPPMVSPPAPPPAPPIIPSTEEVPPAPPIFSFDDLERLVAGRGLAIVGGAALMLGGIFFLGLAFSRGWIGPEARVIIGAAVGVALFAFGGRYLLHRQEIVAHVLVAVGLGVLSVSLYAATRLYGFVGAEAGVGLALVVASAAAALAVRSGSQLIAAFGLVSVLASPPVMGASASLVTMLFLGVALAGTTAISLWRTWRWLPPVAFLLVAPQLASYVLDIPPVDIALVALAAFTVLNIVAAGGEEFRVRRDQLSESSATVLVASAAFAVWAGFEVLSGELEPWRGILLLGLATGYLVAGALFLVRVDERHPFGMLSAGTGIAAVTLAVPIQLGAPLVPLVWAAEAVALAWVYAERRHGWSGLVAALLGALTAGHVLAVEYPLGTFPTVDPAALPFMDLDGAVLGFVLVAALVAIAILRSVPERVAVGAAMAGMLVGVAHHELSGASHVALLTLLTAGCVLVERRLLGIRPAIPWARNDDVRAMAERSLYAAGILAAGVLGWVILLDAVRPSDVVLGLLPYADVPYIAFLNEPTAMVTMVVTGALLVAATAGGRLWRQSGILVAAGFAAALVPTQLGPAWSVAAWCALALALHLLTRDGDDALYIGARVLAGMAVAETLVVVAAPDRLVVRPSFREPPILNGGVLGTAALVAMFVARAALVPRGREARGAAVVAGVFGMWLLSIGLVDLFQASLGGETALEEIGKQAQVALSVLWAGVGVAAFVGGLALRRTSVRLFGLALLGVVTVKVFVVDLAALDVAYRVLSFAALGILLLGAAYLYSRLQPGQVMNDR